MSEPPSVEKRTSSEPEASSPAAAEPDLRAREVRAYLAKLIVLIVIGILLMASVAAWAWFRFAKGIDDTTHRAPFPGISDAETGAR